jgi:dTDP-glucose 4,6-dehydratase
LKGTKVPEWRIRMKTYFVTGGAGFIGTNFIKYLFESYGDDVRVINYDKLTYAGKREWLEEFEEKENYRFVQGDILDEELLTTIFKEEQIDYVVHMAAESHVDRSLQSDDEFFQTNVIGTRMLYHVIHNIWKDEISDKRVLHVSTDEVYGELEESGLFMEDMPLHPNNPYSASKAGGEMIAISYHKTYGLPIVRTRCSNNFGPYQNEEKLIPKCIKKCLNHKKIPVYGDGKNMREWLFVKDHCIAMNTVLLTGELGEVYNIGSHQEMSALHIVTTILHYLKEHVDSSLSMDLIEFTEDRLGHDKRYAVDTNKIESNLGWTPKTDFEKGMAVTINWYLKEYGFR